MKVRDVENMLVRVPLGRPVSMSTRTFTARDFNVVRLTTEDGITGVGYARGGELVRAAVEHELRPLLLGRDALATEIFWEDVWRETGLVGRQGALLRALSAVDIALWDIKAKAAGLPLFRLLGGADPSVPAYVSGGYYRDGQTEQELAYEMAGYVERGFRAVKIRVGRLKLRDDVRRVAAVRAAIGDDVDLMVDANQAYRSSAEAIAAGRAFAEQGVRWLEEPLGPEHLAATADVAAALDLPIAGGEVESTRWAFRDIIERKALDILQPDVTVVGGISEWLKVAAVQPPGHYPSRHTTSSRCTRTLLLRHLPRSASSTSIRMPTSSALTRCLLSHSCHEAACFISASGRESVSSLTKRC